MINSSLAKAIILSLSLVVTACGGGSSSSPTTLPLPPPPPPELGLSVGNTAFSIEEGQSAEILLSFSGVQGDAVLEINEVVSDGATGLISLIELCNGTVT